MSEAWSEISLGQMFTLQRGYDLPSRLRRPGNIPIVSSAGPYDFHDTYQIKYPGVVTGRYGTIGEVFYIEENFWPLNTTLYVSDFKGNNPRYISYLLRTVDFLSHSGKSGVPGINRNDIHELQVLRPPKEEQTAIATALSDVDALINSLEKLIAKKRAIKTAAMQQLLTGKKRLPPFDTLASKENSDGKKRGYKQTELGEIPVDWEVYPFFSMVEIAQGQVSPKHEPYKSMVLVGPKHVESATGKLLFTETASEQGAVSGKYIFQNGDVLYGKINPYLMKAALATFSGLCSADMYPLRPSENLCPGFLLSVILGDAFTKYAISVSARSGMPKINRKEFSEYKFIAPSDRVEQEAISSVLRDMDKDIEGLEKRLNKTQQLKQGMMQELLTGRTRLV